MIITRDQTLKLGMRTQTKKKRMFPLHCVTEIKETKTNTYHTNINSMIMA